MSLLKIIATLPYKALQQSIIYIIYAYRSLSGAFFSGCCRFEPSCSHFAVEAVKTRCVIKGLLFSGVRICKCNPLFKGGYDPVTAYSIPRIIRVKK